MQLLTYMLLLVSRFNGSPFIKLVQETVESSRAVVTYIHTYIHDTHILTLIKHMLAGKTIQKFGWNCTFVDVGDEAAVRAAVQQENVKCLWAESLANPGGIVSDIRMLSNICQEARIPLIIDNTMATPYLCRPFEHGADLIVHSTTKFLSGKTCVYAFVCVCVCVCVFEHGADIVGHSGEVRLWQDLCVCVCVYVYVSRHGDDMVVHSTLTRLVCMCLYMCVLMYVFVCIFVSAV
jgi:hypothetical protein